jgi:hypothetical protein
MSPWEPVVTVASVTVLPIEAITKVSVTSHPAPSFPVQLRVTN